jgi:hypothetical protein
LKITFPLDIVSSKSFRKFPRKAKKGHAMKVNLAQAMPAPYKNTSTASPTPGDKSFSTSLAQKLSEASLINKPERQIDVSQPLPTNAGDSPGNVPFNSILQSLLQQPQLTTLEKAYLATEAARRNLSSASKPKLAAVDDIASIIHDLSKNNPHIAEATQEWLNEMRKT